jgi:hypothetical protein
MLNSDNASGTQFSLVQLRMSSLQISKDIKIKIYKTTILPVLKSGLSH